MLPTVEQEILGQGLNVVEKAFAGAALLADLLVGAINEVEHGMEQKGE